MRVSASALASGAYTGLSCFLDAAAFSTVVFLPAGLPLDVGIQHALLGFVLMQATVSALSPAGTIVAPVSYEVMPFLARFAAGLRKAVPAPGALLSTVLAGSMLISAAAAAACSLLSLLPIGGSLERLLPPALHHTEVRHKYPEKLLSLFERAAPEFGLGSTWIVRGGAASTPRLQRGSSVGLRPRRR